MLSIQVAGVNLEERKIDFQLIQQVTHAGRVVRSRAPRTTRTSTQATEEVFGKPPSTSNDGEKPVRKKKEKGKPSSYTKKSGKKPLRKQRPSQKNKEKAKPKKKSRMPSPRLTNP